PSSGSSTLHAESAESRPESPNPPEYRPGRPAIEESASWSRHVGSYERQIEALKCPQAVGKNAVLFHLFVVRLNAGAVLRQPAFTGMLSQLLLQSGLQN